MFSKRRVLVGKRPINHVNTLYNILVTISHKMPVCEFPPGNVHLSSSTTKHITGFWKQIRPLMWGGGSSIVKTQCKVYLREAVL